MNEPHRKHQGFTLVEILVVVSIIAVLMSILMPALGMARKQTKRLVCQNNLRQMAIAAHTYCSSFDEHYPIAYYSFTVNRVFTSLCWDFTTRKDWNQSPAEETVEPGLLWQGQTNVEIQQCPVFKGEDNWLDDPYTGYNYNTSYLGHNAAVDPQATARTTDVRHPDQTAIFGDGEYSNGANKFMRAPQSNPRDADFNGRYAGVQGFRHLGATNVAFCDGHVTAQKDLYTDSDPTDQTVLDKYNETADVKIGFLSADNSSYDLK